MIATTYARAHHSSAVPTAPSLRNLRCTSRARVCKTCATDVGAREATRCKSQLQTGATKESNFRRKCIRDLSTLSKLFPRSPACPSPFLTPARDFEAAAAMATPSLPPETLHHFPFMLRATRRTDGLHHKLFSPPSLSETPGSSRAADGQRRYVVPRAARLL